MGGLNAIAVYEWNAWELFLIGNLVDPACRITADHDDPAEVLAPLIAAGVTAVLPQIDLSCSAAFPRHRSKILAYARRRGLIVLNAHVDDIRKDRLHRLLSRAGLPTARADPVGTPDDWLFVKSNLNAGGKREAECQITRNGIFGFHAEAHILHADAYYPVQRRDVDPALWRDPSVVIERYIVNPENSFYRLYRFGEAVVVVKGHCPGPIKKLSGHSADRNHPFDYADLLAGRTGLPRGLDTVLARFLEHTRLAYCCIDVMHDATGYYIVDLNLTPYSGTEDENPEMIRFLQEGAERHLAALTRVSQEERRA